METVIKQMEKEGPMLVIGSLPCSYFSSLQELNKFNMRCNEVWLARCNGNFIMAIDHIKFCIKLYCRQIAG